MTSLPTEPGSPADMRFAATLVVEGLLPEATARAVIAKQRELAERGRPLTVAEIATRKAWITATEARWLADLGQPPRDLLPGFRIERPLGLGGMSRVFGARREADGARRALKILLPRLARDASSRHRFEAESELSASILHPHLIHGFGVLAYDGLVVMELEWFDASTALELLDQRGRMPEDEALAVVVQVARALQALHERGMVHRDVKPGNVLIDRQGSVKLCDLGLAVPIGGLPSGPRNLTAGTAAYVAPEQAVGAADLDARTDIYALGVTLYHLVTGSLPFEGETDAETMARRLWDELHSPALKGLGISPPTHYLIQKMMALDPSHRFASARALVEDIQELIAGRERQAVPVAPRRPSGSVARPAFGPGSGPAVPRPRDPMRPLPRPPRP